ncbi:hypothetical protein PLESTF_000156700 [Pleodorina starrii]|nr:hypothetical protein PLESTF_000156700 [Pleodorina starrii]
MSGLEVESVQRLLLQLYAQHKESARQKGVVEFAHVSKSGGTTICQLARGNGCKSESFAPHTNCLIAKFHDEPRYLDGNFHQMLHGKTKTKCDKGFKTMHPRTKISCTERRRWLQRKGYTLYANEYTAFGGQTDPGEAHACRNMLTVLQIRHPRDRVISHIRHVWHAYRVHCGEDRRLYFSDGHNTSHWSGIMPAPTNNYLIRSLLGQAVFNLPVGGITRAHLDLARIRLVEQYDVVLVLEDHELLRQALRAGLGWGVTERHANPSHSDPEDGLPSDLGALWELNDLDVELYHLGVLMARLDAVVYEVAAAAGAAEAAAGAGRAAAAAGEGAVAGPAAVGGSGGSGNSSDGGSGAQQQQHQRKMKQRRGVNGDGDVGARSSEGGEGSDAAAAAAGVGFQQGNTSASGEAPGGGHWLLWQWLLSRWEELDMELVWGTGGAGGKRAQGGGTAGAGTWRGRWLAATTQPRSPSAPVDGQPTCGWVGDMG